MQDKDGANLQLSQNENKNIYEGKNYFMIKKFFKFNKRGAPNKVRGAWKKSKN